MGFGQHSANGKDRMSKRDMVAQVESEGIRVKDARMVKRNTLSYITDMGECRLRLHGTDVAIKYPNDTIEIDTGGYNTKTTRDRLNDALDGTGLTVYTRAGSIHVGGRGQDCEFVRWARIESTGNVVTDLERGDSIPYDDVRAYVERYVDKLKRYGVPLDMAGDPWIPVGSDGLYRAEHVRFWIGEPSAVRAHGEDPTQEGAQEPYVFGTLVYNALRWSGLADAGARMFMHDFNNGRGDARRMVTQKVRRYLRACLGYASS